MLKILLTKISDKEIIVSPGQIAKELNLIRDPTFNEDIQKLETIIMEAFDANPKEFKEANKNTRKLRFFVGQVLKSVGKNTYRPVMVSNTVERLFTAATNNKQ